MQDSGSVRTLTRLTFAAALLVGTAASTPALAEELTFQHFVPPVGLMADQYRKWGEMVEKRTEGRVKIKFFWSGAMFSMTQALQSVASGVADIGVASAAYYPTQLPTTLALEHAYNAADLWAGNRATSTLMLKRMPELQKEWEANGVKWIAPYTSGTFQWFQKDEWKGPESFQGKVGRTMGGARQAWYQKVGLKPVFMAITDVYSAVDKSTIAGFENTLSLTNDLKLYEVAPTVVMFNSGVVMSSATIMNLKKFNALSKNDQQVLLDTGVDWGENVIARALYEKEKEVIDQWKVRKGNKVIYPQADQIEQMRKIAREEAVNLAKEQDRKLAPNGKAVQALTALWDEVDKAEKELKAKGHPWK
jgi:TRAP-type C4-dicarboxylate transport system substrate-binding protein